MLEWFLAPIDLTRPHDVSFLTAWHGRFMVLAWGVMVPVAILWARFFKIAKGQKWPEELDNKVWWRSHYILQSLAALVMLFAIWLIWAPAGDSDIAWLHRFIGWTLTAFCATQIIAGATRGSKGGPTDPRGSMFGDHFDMTPRRLMFEYLHKTLGYISLALSWFTIYLGMWIANGPRWMFISISIWFLLLAVAFIICQKRGMAMDTYQAIWGTDPNLPGNRRRPIGPGYRRH
ncbi:cytochrome b561 domain-containing protein [Ahrensia sp. R2A130]|uniref:cytochrome b561 domain-containing protein n=1 Tax=Ahrensia sp. R2A130 TaxID=744979 RepID=UPI0001E0839D|nr:cytochrome b561 domain-containing protein [Ahrensia sp. R2A130]EFL90497.1 cytochrome b561/ferric reductase transmembrane domain-containing protein [Ahrensia sp. R2A130]